ncbi:MAG: gliding motility protein GldL [Flavobacteriales bacterium]|nr:gliding motility protein GldL [Flavobacteriales bacterium]|tara:strand:- start:1621 stop:2235 length:615 start_codon:yes stop_codon:yes gene_type:complete
MALINPNSKKFKNFMAKLYGWGASIVILGALFKLMNWPGAGAMLTIGLGTEAIIFFFSAFEKPHEEPDWSLVYPELAYMKDPNDTSSKKTPTQELDSMLDKANVDQALITRLGDNLRSFNETVEGVNKSMDAVAATGDYSDQMREAARKLAEMNTYYDLQLKTMQNMGNSVGDTEKFQQEIARLGENLAALNKVYGNMLTAMNK